MSKKTKGIIVYVIAFVGFFVVPNVLFGYYNLRGMETYHELVSERSERCYQRAKAGSRDADWCSVITDAATLAYTSGRGTINAQMILLMFQPILFVLFISLYNLRKEFQELKQKADV